MFSRHRRNLRATPSCCELGQSTMNRMKSLQLEQLSDHIFWSSIVVSYTVSRNPRLMLRSSNRVYMYQSTAASAFWCACRLSSCSAYSISYVDDRPRHLRFQQCNLKLASRVADHPPMPDVLYQHHHMFISSGSE